MTQPGRRMFSVAKDWEELFENVEPGRRIARKTWIEEIPKSKEPGQNEKWCSLTLFTRWK